MSRKYKIIKIPNGFAVWKLKDFGNGYGLEPINRRFQTEEEAQIFIEQDKKKGKDGDKNDVNRKSSGNKEKKP